ncbi:cytochrome P450 [Phanerochaete sordida]|uniref:Cytochrome P450 n=1 Tax=Phanerochaete sordida TaxID=48140 RepID=A0A9P3GJS6_9APHY|nr:cytochrome P450 [Phanerochaete sordida]
MLRDDLNCLLSPWLLLPFILAWILLAHPIKRLRYPPSPNGLPIIGNLFDIPVDSPWLKYAELGKQFGSDVVHFEALGRHVVVLNSAKAARDLLEKRSSIYSGRAQSIMLSEITGWHRNWGLWQYNESYKSHRKAFVQHFRPEALPGYYGKQKKGIHTFLHSLIDAPDDFLAHIQYLTGQVILDAVYGFEVARDDPLLALTEHAAFTLKQIVGANMYLADIIPTFRHIPAWFPGGGYKRRAAEWKKLVGSMYEEPYRMYKAALREGTARPCLTSALMSAKGNRASESAELLQVSIAGTTYGAGAGTTMDTLSAFFFALTLFPETQIAVQDELDDVLCRERLPIVKDEAALPRTTAMLYELLRYVELLSASVLFHLIYLESWLTLPGIPHRSTTNDEYNGYLIPAGSIVIANAWAMLHDASVFPEPERFDPTRFLAADGSLKGDISLVGEAFGFGRRICPGRQFARDFVWLAIASILAMFTIEPALDEGGEELETKVEFTTRFMRAPLPFKCRITLRFPEAESLVRSASVDD